ncbi:MAG: hypothetical protein OXE97_03390 [Gammaproteobacteria bacterium]|nr:hypothetical protein [Gammaproteobacteria bacterium]MCY4303725.1 hypothetical protein [Aestuariivita sp.]
METAKNTNHVRKWKIIDSQQRKGILRCYRMTSLLVLFAAVTAVAQEVPIGAEPNSAQAKQETAEQQDEEEAAQVAPEFFDPTEEVSEDYPVEFPIDI